MEELTGTPFVFWCTDIGSNFTQEEAPVVPDEEENYSREGWNT
jgi:hypothetical protein